MKKNHDNFKVGRIMIVDDEAELMTALCEALAGQGYETRGFTTGDDALKILVEQDYDLLLTDLMMPEMDGIALLKAGLEIDPNLVGIIMTGHGTVQTAVEAIKLGAFDYVLKPFKLNTLLPLLSRAMEVRSLRMENIQLRETVAIHELGKVIAFSSDLNAILNKVADATLQQCNADEVSIMLPTRDGKELYVAVARGGHREYIGERVPMERGIAGWVARNRETVIINGKVDDPRFSPVNPRTDIRAAVSMPMMAGGNLVGVLNVNITRSHRHMTLGQVKALSILVSIISPILENTWLNIQIREAEEKYRSIFENAIDGIYQTTPEGQFITANRAMANMLGYDSSEELMSATTDIAGQLYVNPEERTKLKQMLKDNGQVKSFETQLYRKDGRIIWVSVNIHTVCDKKGGLLNYDGIAEDISERKQSEQRQILVNNTLEALNRTNEIINLIRDILILLKEYTGIEAIGIRLREGDDFPYYVTSGFPPHFLETEKYLCTRDNAGEIIRDSHGNPCLECMCGNIICGRTDPKFPFFTEGGSFWSNRTTELLASTSEEDRQACTRNRCNSEGYESVALIPLRSGNEVIGLLQLNDSRQDSFSIKMIQFLEEIGATIGIAVARKRAVEALRESEVLFRKLFEDHAAVKLIHDPNTGDIIDANVAASVFYGWSREQLTQMKIQEINTLSPEEIKAAMENARNGKNINFEFRHRRADGSIRDVNVFSSKIKMKENTLLHSIVHDITDRKRAEEALQESEERYRSLYVDSRDSIMVLSPDRGFLTGNPAAIKMFACRDEHDFTAQSPESLSPEYQPDGVRSLDSSLEMMRLAMEKGSHFFEWTHRRADGTDFPATVLLSRIESGGTLLMQATVRDITERKQAEEELLRTLESLRKAVGTTIQVMVSAVEVRDPYTAGHQLRSADLACAIAMEMGLSQEKVDGIRMAGSIHDIGKLSIPAEILSKPTKLTNIEYSLIKEHSRSGYEMLKDVESPWPLAETVYQHHERMDGSGYPRNLKEDEILMEARIMAVADVVESMGSHRPYRPSLGIEAALEEIEKNKGTLYDNAVADACLRLFREKEYQLL